MENERDMIVIEHLNKSFGSVKAVDNLRFKVKKGGCGFDYAKTHSSR